MTPVFEVWGLGRGRGISMKHIISYNVQNYEMRNFANVVTLQKQKDLCIIK